MLLNVLGVLTIAAVVTVSAAHYKHKGRGYARGKHVRIATPRWFRAVYRYVQATTVVIGSISLLFSHPALLLWPAPAWLRVTGMVNALLGLAVFVWAKRVLADAYSPCFDSFVPAKFVQIGPYRYVRHPIYTANLFILIGLALTSASGWLALNVLVVGAYYLWSASAEERAMTEQLPGYDQYLRNTRRFIPGVL
ncbi:MAG: isoprenylcysteine carboxylmethyltransferase family protein [Phycisphaerales bacterium]|nr:isoprenylcysteine carboxylmethyltransferase family protein [Phycisphaerales bacterium]